MRRGRGRRKKKEKGTGWRESEGDGYGYGYGSRSGSDSGAVAGGRVEADGMVKGIHAMTSIMTRALEYGDCGSAALRLGW